VAEPTITGVPVSIAVSVASTARDGLATDQTLCEPSDTAWEVFDMVGPALGVIARLEKNGHTNTTIVGVYPTHRSHAVVSVTAPLVAKTCIKFLTRRTAVRCPGHNLLTSDNAWQVDIGDEEVLSKDATKILK
jgi:hypothetical protein